MKQDFNILISVFLPIIAGGGIGIAVVIYLSKKILDHRLKKDLLDYQNKLNRLTNEEIENHKAVISKKVNEEIEKQKRKLELEFNKSKGNIEEETKATRELWAHFDKIIDEIKKALSRDIF